MKRIIAFLLAILLCMGMLTCLNGCSSSNTVMTRGGWIELLAQEFGLDQTVSQEPAFTDVTKEDEIYTGVQSCVDWGILNNTESKTFRPNEEARVDFALQTAVAAADVNLGETSVEKFAQEGGVIGNAYLDYNGNLTQGKAEEIVEWARKLYLEEEKQEVEKVVLQDSVKDVSDKVSATKLSDSLYKVSGAQAAGIKVNDVVVFPATKENPYGEARKITSVTRNGDGTYSFKTIEPKIEEVCADLEIVKTAVPKKEDVILADGVTFSDGKTDLAGKNDGDLIPLVAKKETPYAIQTNKGLQLSFNVNFTKGKASLSGGWADLFSTTVDDTGKASIKTDKLSELFPYGEKISVSGEKAFSAQSGLDDTAKLGKLIDKTSIIPDKKLFGKDPYDNTDAIEAYKAGNITLDELKKKLDLTKDQQEKEVASMTNRFKAGYEVTGQLNISNLYLESDIKLKKVLGVPVGIDKMGVEVNCDIDSSLTVKGTISNELTICQIPVPIAGGFSANVKIVLSADFNGKLTVRAEIDNNTKFEYEGGKFKKTAKKSSSLSADLSAQLDVGASLGIDLEFLGICAIDTKVSAGVRLKFNAGAAYKTGYTADNESIKINRQTEYTLKFTAYAPIIKLSVGTGKSLANKLGITFSWELVGEKSAAKFELGSENVVLWKEEQVIKLRDEKKEEEDQKDQFDPSDYLKLKDYYLSVQEGGTGTLTIANFPEGYTAADLIWETEDPAIATVSGGKVTGKDYGSTVVSVKTSDGIYACYASVHIGSEKVDFTPLEDQLLSNT